MLGILKASPIDTDYSINTNGIFGQKVRVKDEKSGILSVAKDK